MQLTSLIFTALTFLTTIQALPVERRSMYAFNGVDYTGKNADGSCHTASEVTANIKMMKSYGITRIRTYSQECEILPNILNAISSLGGGMDVLAAVWIEGSADDDTEISSLNTVLNSKKYDISPISKILVGNEVMFNNYISTAQLIGKLETVKAFANGIPVGFVEVDSTYSPDLIAASDFVAVNLHPFYAAVKIDNALESVQTRYNNVVKTAGGKEVIITETGWPSAGGNMGEAVASLANEKAYAAAVSKSSLPYYYFEWEDSLWKGAGTEGHFGLMNQDDKAKF